MPESVLEVLIRNKVTGLPEVTAEKTAISELGNTTLITAGHTKTHGEHTANAAKAERDLSREAAISARAMGELGAKGGELTERFANLTTAAGGFQGTLLGLGVLGLGAVVEGTKGAIEQAEKHERAVRDLEQAYSAAGSNIRIYDKDIQSWLNTNRLFISDQEQAREGFAMMTRAGLDQNQVMEAMNVSLDIAALKHISLEDAERRVLLGLEGNARGLKELGIQLKTIQGEDDNTVKAHKNLEEANKKVEEATRVHEAAVRHLEEAEVALKDRAHKPTHEELLKLEDAQKRATDASDELAKAQDVQRKALDATKDTIDTQNKTLQELKEKTDDGRASVTNLERSQNDLNRAMQDFGNTLGPIFAESLAQDIEWLLHFGDALTGAKDKLAAFLGTFGGGTPQLSAGRHSGYLGPSGGGGGGGGTGDQSLTVNIPVILDSAMIGQVVDRRLGQLFTAS